MCFWIKEQKLQIFSLLNRQQAVCDQLWIFLKGSDPAQGFQAQTQQLSLRQQIRTGTPTLLTTRQLFFWNYKITHFGEDKICLYKKKYSVIALITLEENKSRATFLCGWCTSLLTNCPLPQIRWLHRDSLDISLRHGFTISLVWERYWGSYLNK